MISHRFAARLSTVSGVCNMPYAMSPWFLVVDIRSPFGIRDCPRWPQRSKQLERKISIHSSASSLTFSWHQTGLIGNNHPVCEERFRCRWGHLCGQVCHYQQGCCHQTDNLKGWVSTQGLLVIERGSRQFLGILKRSPPGVGATTLLLGATCDAFMVCDPF